MNRTIYLFIIFLIWTCGFSYAQGHWTSIGQTGPVPAEVRLLQSTVEETTIQFALEGFMQRPVETPQGKEMMISIDDGVQIMKKGKPDLAKLVTTIIIPDLGEMEVNVASMI